MRYKIFNVFGRGLVGGNPTAVVYYEGVDDIEKMQRIAQELVVPDTLFVMPASNPELLFSSLAFTPHQEISICGQGMIGGLYSWLEDHELRDGRYRIGRRSGESIVEISGRSNPRVFISMGVPRISELNENEKRIATQIAGNDKMLRSAMVALGRKRLLIQVEPNQLADMNLHEADVMAWCDNLGVTGIVIFSETGAGESAKWRSRHFTTSLLGAEDAVTGGATAAILAFGMRCFNVNGDTTHLVHQGGFGTREGFVVTRYDAKSGELFIGGEAAMVTEGTLRD